MDKREQFAIQILAAMIASGRSFDITKEAFAQRAVEIADKLIDALKPEPETHA